tara:strand:- start:595 stop:855 length:261 start_codon:yes stop_codon:yes gene_type:complete
MEAMMTRILFFGRVAERLGAECTLDLPAAGASLGEIRHLLAARDEAAADALLRTDVRASLDQVVAGDDVQARPDQEIAFFSIFSGG